MAQSDFEDSVSLSVILSLLQIWRRLMMQVMDLFTYLPPFNTTTLIKPMTKRKRRPLGRARTFCWNRLAREGHDLGLKEIDTV